jgi:hypothetical protein
LERYLREQMSEAKEPYTRRRFRQIPLYLQDVLSTVSDSEGSGFTLDPDNYSALTNRTLELDDVLFLTLNYDTLLDQRLFNYGVLRSIDSYVDSDPRWAAREAPWFRPRRSRRAHSSADALLQPIGKFGETGEGELWIPLPSEPNRDTVAPDDPDTLMSVRGPAVALIEADHRCYPNAELAPQLRRLALCLA